MVADLNWRGPCTYCGNSKSVRRDLEIMIGENIVMTIRCYLRTLMTYPINVVIGIALFTIAVLITILVMHPLPPRVLVMTTGQEGSAYYELGERYRDIFKKEGIELQLKPSAGSVENLERLRDPRSGVSVGFLIGGITNKEESSDLVSLGTIFYEPFWFFFRSGLSGDYKNLHGKRISIGPEGSGSRKLALEVLRVLGIDEHIARLLPLTYQEAGDKLLRREIDAAIIVTPWHSPIVRKLIAADGVELASAVRADAYVALYPYLNKLILPAGVADMAKHRPPTDVNLIAPKASLVVRKDTHPAIQYLLLDAAEQIHSVPGIFQKAGQFPAAESIDFPLSSQARQFYKSGKPFLQHYLPFWMGAFIEQILILLIPVVAVAYPLFNFLPSVYQWHIQRQIFRLYGELWGFEHDLQVSGTGQDIDEMIKKLGRLEDKANQIQIPKPYLNSLYTLKDHIALVRKQLKKP
jgi:TRAP-type uncharacterized transport system substrate-binding protein